MFRLRGRAIFRRNILRYMVLKAIAEKPMHGYELMKTLGEEFGGPLRPSAGAIYPILQALEEEGYVTGDETGEKRVYSITAEGETLLKSQETMFGKMAEDRKVFIAERKELNRELRNFASLIAVNYRDLTPGQAEEVRQVLQEARRKITDIIFD